MKNIFAFITCKVSFGHVKSVFLKASGMRCIVCSKRIDQALKTHEFIEHLNPDFKDATFDITSEPKSNNYFDKLKNKVEEARFSVSKFVAKINFTYVHEKCNSLIGAGDKILEFLIVDNLSLNGEKQILLPDKVFLSNEVYQKKRLRTSFNSQQVYHATT